MMKIHRLLLVVVVVLGFALPARAQQCGDVNGSGQIDIADISYLFAHFYFNGAPWTPRMDMDDRTGVAHGDIVRIVDNLFISYPNGVYDCTPSQTYSFAPSPNDTLFIPRLTSVPNGINEVTLTIRGSLQPGASGICVFLQMLPGSSGGFQYIESGDYFQNEGFAAGNYWNLDRTKPSYGFAKYRTEDVLAGQQDLHWFKFGRVTPGSTGADLILVENQIDQYRRICVSRDGDLVVPTIVFYEHQFPPDTLKMSVSSLTFDGAAGKMARDTFDVSFTSSGTAITFDLSAADTWVKMLGLPVGTLTTPVTIQVTADGTMLPEGNYFSSIQVQNATSQLGVVMPQADLPIGFVVGPPISYPPGDVNCNGVLDLTDLSMIISYLLGYVSSLPVCY